MRTLSAELLAAQKAGVQQPWVQRVSLSSRRWGVQPLARSPLYSEVAAGQPFGACATPDGAVVRARVTGANEVYTQRVAGPLSATAAAWSGWALLGAGIASSLVAPALVAEGATVSLLYVKTDGTTVVRRMSGDGGLTWGAEVVVAADAAAPVRAVAAAARVGAGVRLYLWACGPNVQGSAVVELRHREESAANVLGAQSIFGLAKFWQVQSMGLLWDGDWHVAATGQLGFGGNPWGVFLLVLGDGARYAAGTWHGTGVLERADGLASYRYSSPSLAKIASAYRCAYWAQRPGGPNRSYVAHFPSTGYDTAGWTAPQPGGVGDAPALLLGLSSGTGLYVGERSAYRVDAPVESAQLGGRLLSYRYRQPGETEIVLGDRDGWSGSAGFGLLRPGASIDISRGLLTPVGNQGVPLPQVEVVRVETGVGGDDRVVRVACRGAGGALSAWRANRSMLWDRDTSLEGILGALCGYAGLELVVRGGKSAQLARKPEFAVSPGEDGLRAVRRLLALTPDRLVPFGARLDLANPEGAAPSYIYGEGGHPLLGWEEAWSPVEPNHVQVYGRSGGAVLYGESLDQGQVDRLGQRIAKLLDASVASSGEAAGRAEAELAVARRRSLGGTLRSVPHLGLELWDRVEVRPAPGAPAAAHTVTAYEERLDLARGEWRQVVGLGGE